MYAQESGGTLQSYFCEHIIHKGLTDNLFIYLFVFVFFVFYRIAFLVPLAWGLEQNLLIFCLFLNIIRCSYRNTSTEW